MPGPKLPPIEVSGEERAGWGGWSADTRRIT